MIDPHYSLPVLLLEGVTSPRPFSKFLAALATEVHAESATILIDRQGRDQIGGIYSSDLPPSRRVNYQAAFDDDPFVDLCPGRPTTLAEHLGISAAIASPFVQSFMIPHGVLHILGLDIVLPGGPRVRLRAPRRIGMDDFGEREKAVFASLHSCVREAMAIFVRLNAVEAERDAFSGVLDRMAVGALLVSSKGDVLRATEGAQRILDRGDPLKLASERVMVSQGGARQGELADAIARMSRTDVKPGSVHAMLLDCRKGGAASVLVRPNPFAGQFSTPLRGTALIHVSDANSNAAPSKGILSQLFGFTPSEAELAALLARGLSLDEASVHLGVSKNTSKAHLRAIFNKSGATRQSNLMRLLLRTVDELS